MTDLKFDHAGTPEPPPLSGASSSEVSPHGSAGLVNEGVPETVGLVGPVYSDLASASAASAMSKRESDWHSLMSGNTPPGETNTSSGY